MQNSYEASKNIENNLHSLDPHLNEEQYGKPEIHFGEETIAYLKRRNLESVDYFNDEMFKTPTKAKGDSVLLELFNPDNDMVVYELNKKKRAA